MILRASKGTRSCLVMLLGALGTVLDLWRLALISSTPHICSYRLCGQGPARFLDEPDTAFSSSLLYASVSRQVVSREPQLEWVQMWDPRRGFARVGLVPACSASVRYRGIFGPQFVKQRSGDKYGDPALIIHLRPLSLNCSQSKQILTRGCRTPAYAKFQRSDAVNSQRTNN